MLCIGKKGTGKSTMVYNLAYFISQYIDIAIAMTPSLASQEEFKRILPSCFVYSDYREDKIITLVENQRKLQAAGEYVPKVAIFLDDLGYDKRIFNTKIMRDLIMNGRQINITLVFALQYCMDISTAIRSGIDYIFVFMEKIMKNRKRLHDNFFGMFQTFEGFEKTFFACTENFECLVMDNTTQTNDIEGSVFYYKAALPETLPKFHLCKDKYLKMARYCRNKYNNTPKLNNLTTATDYSANAKITEVEKVPVKRKKKRKVENSETPTEPLHVDMS